MIDYGDWSTTTAAGNLAYYCTTSSTTTSSSTPCYWFPWNPYALAEDWNAKVAALESQPVVRAIRRWQHRNGVWRSWKDFGRLRWTVAAQRLERRLRSLRPVLKARAPYTHREHTQRVRAWTRRR